MNNSFLLRSEQQEVKAKVKLYFDVNRFDAAEKLLKATLIKNGPNAALYNLLGVTFHKQSRFGEAIKNFRSALKTNPSFTEAALNLTSTLCDVSQYDDAKEVFEQLGSALHQEFYVPHLIVGRLANLHAVSGQHYAKAGLIEDAIQEFKKALHLFPKLPDVKFALANLYLSSESYEKARQEFEELIFISPQMIEAHNQLGLTCYKLGREDAAKQHWETAASIDPEDSSSRLYLRSCNNR